jgi:hypothetical protein
VRIAKVISVMLFGPLLGVMTGFLFGVITVEVINLLHGYNDAFNRQHPAPGDGIMIMIFGFFGLLVAIPLSVLLAGRLWQGQSSVNEAQIGKE